MPNQLPMDQLWDVTYATQPSGLVVPKHARRNTPKYEWKIGQQPPSLGDHSGAKHDIFDQYLDVYIERLTRMPSQEMLNLTIVDGFCGGGIYRRGKATVDGSPLRLLQIVEAADRRLNAARSKGFRIKADFFFIDQNPDHTAFLTDALHKRGYGSRIGEDVFVVTGRFDETSDRVISHIKRKGTAHRSIWMLDQYGWSDVPFGTIRSILGELRNPEILLTFAVDSLINFLSENSAVAKALLNVELTREDVRDLIAFKDDAGWRYLIQNGLYRHIQAQTRAQFYTPFFIRSRESNRAYWLLHLSNHRQARDEMGKLHWALTNRFEHHGGAGFHALGFDPRVDLRQNLLAFMFDDDAMTRSESAVLTQLPDLLRQASSAGVSLEVEGVFAGHCNDTPVTSDIVNRSLLLLRDEGELEIASRDGAVKPRARTVRWDDRIILPAERSLFSVLGAQRW